MPSWQTGPRAQACVGGLVVLLIGLSGCAPAVIGGAAVGASAIYDRRDAQSLIDDQQIELEAIQALVNDPLVSAGARISATSYNRSVLLTGQADTEEVARQASDLVSRLSKVTRVIDEIDLGPAASLARETEDALVTSRAKLALANVSLPGFNPTRVKVVTENGVVYMLGLVSRAEGDAAAEQVRYVPGVTQVVKLFERYDGAN
jgi:osmotically-inducible protein OsmY